MDIKTSENLIDSVKWRFAKTMPEIPHEYIVTNDYPEKRAEIAEFTAEIEQNGYSKTFFTKTYKYLNIGGYKYWVIENIINRAKIEEKIDLAKIEWEQEESFMDDMIEALDDPESDRPQKEIDSEVED